MEINDRTVNADQEERYHELQLQDLRLRECYLGEIHGYSKQDVTEATKKEFISL